jgi:hypothetical protein
MAETASTTTTATDALAAQGRWTNFTLWALQIIMALFFAGASAFPKLIAHSSAVGIFDRIGFGDWYMYLIGTLELAGAVALLIPLLSGLAGLAFIGLMIGAFLTQLLALNGENAATPLIVMVLVGIIAWGRRRDTARLIALLKGRA